MHLLSETDGWDPFPRIGDGSDVVDRRDAHRAIAVSAVGLLGRGGYEVRLTISG